jgi:hypothetical protein
MSRSLDLNQLRSQVLENQSRGTDSRPVHVDKEGRITTDPRAAQQPNLSRVPQQTFASRPAEVINISKLQINTVH